MRPFFTCLSFLGLFLITPSLFAQTPDTAFVQAQPPTSLPALALHYYSIDWTAEQWDTLRGRELELFYLIDNIGGPFLQSVRGTDRADILDSLNSATSRLLYFTPAQYHGGPVESAYGFYFAFPDRPPPSRASQLTQYAPGWPYSTFVSPEELREDYLADGIGFTVDYNAFFASYLGAPSAYAAPGGGIDIAPGLQWSPRWRAGLSLGFNVANLRKALPEDPLVRTDGSLANGYAAATLDRIVKSSAKAEWNIRGELGYGSFRIANDDDEQPDGELVHGGLHTGLLLQYANSFGNPAERGAVRDYRGRVQQPGFGYNVLAGIRYRYLGNRTGTGIYLFLGAGIRIGSTRYSRVATP